MAGQEPHSLRASDADRERTVHVLRDALVEGQVSFDTFSSRIDVALRARDHRELQAIVADLGAAPAPRRSRFRFPHWPLAARRQLPPLALPTASMPIVLVGRGSDSDVVLSDIGVSRVHAFLMISSGEWLLTDRRSTNGTFVNGRRIWGTTRVWPGEVVTFGRSSLRLVAPD